MDIFTKTLFIQIDDTPMPLTQPELIKLVPTIDCRPLLNDFYSILGDALCGDLTAPNGQPLYRLLAPVDRILAEYATSEDSAEAMADLRSQWYNLIKTIVEGSTLSTYTFFLPKHFRKWLELHPTNELYNFLASQSTITITEDYITEIRTLIYKIGKDVCIDDCKRYVLSGTDSAKKWHIDIKNLDQPITFQNVSIDGCVLGRADWYMFARLCAIDNTGNHKPFEYLNYRGAQIWFKDDIWKRTFVNRYNGEIFIKFLKQVCLCNYDASFKHFEFYEPSIIIKEEPYRAGTYFSAKLEKTLPNGIICELHFFYDFNNKSNIIPYSEITASGTLYSIRIEKV